MAHTRWGDVSELLKVLFTRRVNDMESVCEDLSTPDQATANPEINGYLIRPITIQAAKGKGS